MREDDYSSTHYNFVNSPKRSNLQKTVDNAVIRNDIGNLVVRQCHPKIHTEIQQTRQKQEFNGKTVVDILNRLQMNNRLYKIVMDKR